MDTQEKLPITRKTAIYKAISLLERQGNRQEEIVILQELATGMPILQWSEKVAKDCIDNFYLDNGRLPTVTDLQKKNTGLPAHTNFKYLFGVTASQWLAQHSQSYEPPKTTRKRKKAGFPPARFIGFSFWVCQCCFPPASTHPSYRSAKADAIFPA